MDSSFCRREQELIVGEGVLNALFGRDSAMEAKHLLPGQVFQSLKNVNSAVGEVPFLSGMVEEAVNSLS